MKRFGLALVVCACTHTSVPVVHVQALPSLSENAEGTLFGECRIAGNGERPPPGKERPEFAVFATQNTKVASIVIALPAEVRVTWSRFPASPMAQARAHIDIGGQKLLRFAGWSSLLGRSFTLKKRAYGVPGHTWGRAGAPVEIIAAEGATAIARVDTPFSAPLTFVVRGACDAFAYEPDEPEMSAFEHKPKATIVYNTRPGLDLYASSDAPSSFGSIVVDGAESLAMDRVAQKGGFVRVMVESGLVGFDAWVPEAQVREDATMGFGSIGLEGFGTSSCGGSISDRGTITRDTALFIGDESPEELAGATVETGAEILYSKGAAKTVGTKVLVPFSFVSNAIRAAGEQIFWVDRDSISG